MISERQRQSLQPGGLGWFWLRRAAARVLTDADSEKLDSVATRMCGKLIELLEEDKEPK